MKTRTGGFSIGLRYGQGSWQKDLPTTLAWLRENGLEAYDLGGGADQNIRIVLDAGLRVGSVDLVGWNDWKLLISPDSGTRKAAVDRASAYVAACAIAAGGPVNHFLVLLPEDPARPRAENFAFMAESLAALAPALAAHQARLCIEAWPGSSAAGPLCPSRS